MLLFSENDLVLTFLNAMSALLDLSFLIDVSGNDPKYMSEIINIFLGTMPAGLVELEDIIRNSDDWDAIYKQAHFLKSSASIVRTGEVYENLARIEDLAREEKNKPEILALLDRVLDDFNRAHPLLIQEQEKYAALL
jgi:HPt (histidine-containing phosphotransfer) domain-containing protein